MAHTLSPVTEIAEHGFTVYEHAHEQAPVPGGAAMQEQARQQPRGRYADVRAHGVR
jgi:hypothetical protein